MKQKPNKYNEDIYENVENKDISVFVDRLYPYNSIINHNNINLLSAKKLCNLKYCKEDYSDVDDNWILTGDIINKFNGPDAGVMIEFNRISSQRFYGLFIPIIKDEPSFNFRDFYNKTRLLKFNECYDEKNLLYPLYDEYGTPLGKYKELPDLYFNSNYKYKELTPIWTIQPENDLHMSKIKLHKNGKLNFRIIRKKNYINVYFNDKKVAIFQDNDENSEMYKGGNFSFDSIMCEDISFNNLVLYK
jgi:hypothetical protein